jgi:hypothetical protein
MHVVIAIRRDSMKYKVYVLKLQQYSKKNQQRISKAELEPSLTRDTILSSFVSYKLEMKCTIHVILHFRMS